MQAAAHWIMTYTLTAVLYCTWTVPCRGVRQSEIWIITPYIDKLHIYSPTVSDFKYVSCNIFWLVAGSKGECTSASVGNALPPVGATSMLCWAHRSHCRLLCCRKTRTIPQFQAFSKKFQVSNTRAFSLSLLKSAFLHMCKRCKRPHKFQCLLLLITYM